MLARGNEGVAGRIKVSEGSIGYVEYHFAKRLGLPMAHLQNRAGRFVAPERAQRADGPGRATSSRCRPTCALFLPDPEGEDAYPIVTFSWLLLYDRYPDREKAAALKQFVTWGLTEGQSIQPRARLHPAARRGRRRCSLGRRWSGSTDRAAPERDVATPWRARPRRHRGIPARGAARIRRHQRAPERPPRPDERPRRREHARRLRVRRRAGGRAASTSSPWATSSTCSSSTPSCCAEPIRRAAISTRGTRGDRAALLRGARRRHPGHRRVARPPPERLGLEARGRRLRAHAEQAAAVRRGQPPHRGARS